VLVGIRAEPGVIDVIDTTSLTNDVNSIPVDGSVHKRVRLPVTQVCGQRFDRKQSRTVVDLHTEQAVWEVQFDSPVRHGLRNEPIWFRQAASLSNCLDLTDSRLWISHKRAEVTPN